MDKTNKFADNIDEKFKEQLPLTYRMVQSIQNNQNEIKQPYSAAMISMKFYESKSIEPSGFYRPISKIVKLVTNE